MESKLLKVIAKHLLLICFYFLFAVFFMESAFASENEQIQFVDPTHGIATIIGDNTNYYFFRSKITTKQKATVTFGYADCSVTDQNGKEFNKYWIYIAGWSAGLSVAQQAPIMMNTLSVILGDGSTSNSHQWNTSMVSGPNGALSIDIPEGGYVELYLLWEVQSDFIASRIKIIDKLNIEL